MVAKDYVLTDCHCIGSYDLNKVLQFQDSILLAPAYNNGSENPLFCHSLGTKYITLKDNMCNYFLKDVALIKLDKELGNETGWMGIAFSNDDSFLRITYSINSVIRLWLMTMIQPEYIMEIYCIIIMGCQEQ